VPISPPPTRLGGGGTCRRPVNLTTSATSCRGVGVFAPPRSKAGYLTAFRKGLAEAGYIEGQNLVIEYRWAGGEIDRVRTFAAELVRRNVALIFAAGALAPVVAAKTATSTIPIVFVSGGDPVKGAVADVVEIHRLAISGEVRLVD
jgi:putative tryptophan/tyrosine transport system substrate-binding protein